MTRQQEIAILRLWRQWCNIWPAHYGHESLQVEGGYDPSFDVIPAQMYLDFYHDVTRRHSRLQHLNVFEVVDTALNQTRAPETLIADDSLVDVQATVQSQEDESLPLPVVTVELEQIANPEIMRASQRRPKPRRPSGGSNLDQKKRA